MVSRIRSSQLRVSKVAAWLMEKIRFLSGGTRQRATSNGLGIEQEPTGRAMRRVLGVC